MTRIKSDTMSNLSEEDGEGGFEFLVDEHAPSLEAVLLKSSGTSENVGPTEV